VRELAEWVERRITIPMMPPRFKVCVRTVIDFEKQAILPELPYSFECLDCPFKTEDPNVALKHYETASLHHKVKANLKMLLGR
jgi:hypothetical protein